MATFEFLCLMELFGNLRDGWELELEVGMGTAGGILGKNSMAERFHVCWDTSGASAEGGVMSTIESSS